MTVWLRFADWCVPAGSVFPRHLTRSDRPPAFITTPRTLTHDEFEQLKRRWIAQHRSPSSSLVVSEPRSWWT